MSTFEIGEVAIFHDPGNGYHGKEVTIIGPLEHGMLLVGRNRYRAHWHHAVDVMDCYGKPSYAPVEYLRKRRPPQDWKSLCKLDEIPAEEVA